MFFAFSSAIAILGSSCYFSFSANKITSNNQPSGEKEFLDFLARKKELPQANEEVPLVAAGQAAYFWNSGKNNFEKIFRAATETSKHQAGASGKGRADLDKIQEAYILEDGRLNITENANLVWRSPVDWWIDNFILADANNDGVLDISLSVWKAGNFGASKPFWLEKNDLSVKNHFFVFDLVNGAIKPIWQSSNLSAPNREFTFADVRGGGKNDLIVIEGDYSRESEREGNYVAVWYWNGWGFANEWRSEQGNFSNLRVEKNNGKNYIVVDSLGGGKP